MRTRVCFTALWLLSSAVANADAFHVSESFKLPKADRRVVAEIACVKPYGVGVEEISGAYSHNGRYAMARCKPHDFVDKLPIQYEVSCAREGTAWTCSAGAFLPASQDRAARAALGGATRHPARSPWRRAASRREREIRIESGTQSAGSRRSETAAFRAHTR